MKALQIILIVFAFFTGCTQKKLVQEAPSSKGPVQEESNAFVQDEFYVSIQEESDASGIVLCDISNYEDFIYNYSLLDQHIEKHKTGCNLEGVSFKDMDMTGANFKNANLKGADLTGVDLRNTNLQSVNLTGSNLTNARMDYAILMYADLRGATLTNTRMDYAILIIADVRDTNLIDVSLIGADLKNALYSNATQFKKGFSPEKYGMLLFDEHISFTR